MNRSTLTGIITSFAVLGGLVASASSPAFAQNACWTESKCVAKCAATWNQFGWKSAADCAKGFPCSKYPKRCPSGGN